MALKLTIRKNGEEYRTEDITDFSHGVSRALAFQTYGDAWGATLWESVDRMAAGLNGVKFKTGVALYYTVWDTKHGAQGVDCRSPFVRMRERIMSKLMEISTGRDVIEATYPGMASDSRPTREAKLALEVMAELREFIA